MPSSCRSLTVIASAGRVRTTRRRLLLSGLACLVVAPALAQMPAAPVVSAAPVVPGNRAPLDDPFAGYVAEAAQTFGLPATWIRAVIAAESNGDPHARSPKGAMGLMQIMPGTWADLRERYALGDDPFAPRANILAGAAYLREMLDRYGSPGFLAAYHAGPERYEDHLASGRPLPAETRAYVALLAPIVGSGPAVASSAKPRSWTDAPLFVALAGHISTAAPTQADHQPDDGPVAFPARDLSAILPQSAGLFVARRSSGAPQ